MVTLAKEGGAETLAEQSDAAARDRRGEVERHPVVRSIMATFPGAEIESVRTIAGAGAGTGASTGAGDAGEPEPVGEDQGDMEP